MDQEANERNETLVVAHLVGASEKEVETTILVEERT